MPQRVSYKWPFFDELMVRRSILFPAVTLHPGMCRSKAVCVREETVKKTDIQKDRGKRTESLCFLWLNCS